MYYAIWIVLAFLFLIIVRNVKVSTIWDRLLGLNLISTKIIIIIILFASSTGLDYLLDFAIIYAITGFIGTIFIASFMADRIIARKEGN